MIYAKLDVSFRDHPRALRAGPHGRDLWFWGMMYIREHATDGFIPTEAIVACPWGRGSKANVALAAKLVEVGLWAASDGGFVMLRYAEKGNETKAQIDERRHYDRVRKATPAAEKRPSRKGAVDPTQEQFRWDRGCLPSGIPALPLPMALDLDLDLSRETQPVAIPIAEQRRVSQPSPEPRERPPLTLVRGGSVAARPISDDEPLTAERVAMFDALVFASGEQLVDSEVWRSFVDDRIKREALVLSERALDADWRSWVRRETQWAKSRRIRERDAPRRGRDVVQQAVPGSWKMPEVMF